METVGQLAPVVAFVVGFLLARGPAVYHWATHTSERLSTYAKLVEAQATVITSLEEKLSPRETA